MGLWVHYYSLLVALAMRILLVDDEQEMADPLSQVLKRQGYEVDVAYDGDRGSQLALHQPYDLLILDWMLPGRSGLEICQQVRSQGNTTPVLFLTAKDTIDDRVQGLDAGADDYLVKPFELRELMARVRALLRRPGTTAPSGESGTSQRLSVGDLELDIDNQRAYRQGREIELSDKETQLLRYLMHHAGQVLTHEQLYDFIWGNSAEKPTSNALAAQMRLLRRKIELDGDPPLISTVYGKGYRLG
jgi:two-component system, OmpR family, manganese sensing response regulator